MTAVTWWRSWLVRGSGRRRPDVVACMSNMTLTRSTTRTGSVRRLVRTVGTYTGTSSATGSYTGAPSIVGSYTGTHTSALGSYVRSQR